MEIVDIAKAVSDQISVVTLLLIIIIAGAKYYIQREKEHKEEIREWKETLKAKDEEVSALQEKVEERVLSHSDRVREDLYAVIKAQMEAAANVKDLAGKIDTLILMIKTNP